MCFYETVSRLSTLNFGVEVEKFVEVYGGDSTLCTGWSSRYSYVGGRGDLAFIFGIGWLRESYGLTLLKHVKTRIGSTVAATVYERVVTSRILALYRVGCGLRE